MKLNMDTIQFESRQEIANIQDVCETFIELSKCAGEKDMRESAKKLSELLESMYMSW